MSKEDNCHRRGCPCEVLHNLQLCERMFELEFILEVPDSRVGTVDNTFEAVVPPFCQVGGSRKSADGGFPLVPSKLVVEGIRGRCPKPGVLHLFSEGRHVSWKKRLEESPRHVDIVRRDEGEIANHLEGLPHL